MEDFAKEQATAGRDQGLGESDIACVGGGRFHDF